MSASNNVANFTQNGYALLPEFFTPSQVAELKTECQRLVSQFDPEHHQTSVFSAGLQQSTDNYFLDSNDKIRYFLEKNAWDSSQSKLTVPKELCLNKIGHALHWHNEVFKRFTFSNKFKQLARDLGLVDPVVVQSMIIFKNPSTGSEVPSHQDASYLYSTPDPRVVGFWIPMENATEENGCLEFIPGSHQSEPLRTRWVRRGSPGQVNMEYTVTNYQYQGKFVPQPAPIGSCMLIDGLVVHRSSPNLSQLPRPVYTFHVFDQANRKWDLDNWLQPSQHLPFPSLYRTEV